MFRNSNTQNRQEGFALVSVLWAVAALSLIAAAVMSSSLLARKVQKNLEREAVADSLLEAGVARACLGLLDTRPEEAWRADGTSYSLTLLDHVFTILVQDETGRVDLNTAGIDLFRALFRSAGVADREADMLSNRILDWRSSSGLESLGVDREKLAQPGLRPRKGPFQSVDELKLVSGMTEELFQHVSPALTIFSQKADVDPVVAPRGVLALMPGITEERLDALLETRHQSASFRPNTQARAGRAFSVTVSVEQDGQSFVRTAVFRLMPGGPVPCLRLF